MWQVVEIMAGIAAITAAAVWLLELLVNLQ